MINTSGERSQGHYFDHLREVPRHDHKGSENYLNEYLSFFETKVKILLTHCPYDMLQLYLALSYLLGHNRSLGLR